MDQDQYTYKSDEERELDTFCQLEEALMEEEKESGGGFKDSKLALEFPDTFIHPDGTLPENKGSISSIDKSEFHEMLAELQQKLTLVRKREASLLRSENWVETEKAQLAKEKQKFEEEKKGYLQTIEQLKSELEFTKKQLEEERIKYQMEHAANENHDKKEKLKVTFITPDAEEPNHEEEDKHHEEEDIKQVHEEEEEKHEIPIEIHHEEEEKKEVIIEPPKPVVVETNPQQTTIQPKKPKIYKILLSENYVLDFDYNPGSIFKEESKKGGRRDVKYKDGSTGTVFKDGTRKAIKEVNRVKKTYIFYANQDVSIEFPDKAIAYKYKETGAIEITLPNGQVVYLFKNGQKERHHPNGDKEVQFPNGIYKILRGNGDMETHYPDGKCEKVTRGKYEISYEYV